MKVKILMFENEKMYKIKNGEIDGEKLTMTEDFFGKTKRIFKKYGEPITYEYKELGLFKKQVPCYVIMKDIPYTLKLANGKLTYDSSNLNKLIKSGIINELLGNIFSVENLVVILGAVGVGVVIGWIIKALLSGF